MRSSLAAVRGWALASGLGGLAAAIACSSDTLAVADYGGTDAAVDASSDGATDQSSDGRSDQEAAPDAADARSRSTLDEAWRWATFDIAIVNAGARGFAGAVFDGRYVYFVPDVDETADACFDAHGIVARYDTKALFTASVAWATFDVATVSARAKGFQGGAFDGRYVYFAPYADTKSSPWQPSVLDGVVARYDTLAAFTTSGSWATFDVAAENPAAVGFWGAVFDGRYVYFVPFSNGEYHGVVARYDTQASFTTASAWATFDLKTANAGAKSFIGAVFDGRYVYFVPFANDEDDDGVVVRYDTQASFTTMSAWATFDMTTVNAAAKGYAGAAFDGRYVYFAPFFNEHYDGVVARYDTHGVFTTSDAWTTFDATAVNPKAKGFSGAVFDGRHVYFVPDFLVLLDGSFDGVMARYDTRAAFSSAGSWATFDMTTLSARAAGFWGATFDGRYVYFAPAPPSSIAARFDTKWPSRIPSED